MNEKRIEVEMDSNETTARDLECNVLASMDKAFVQTAKYLAKIADKKERKRETRRLLETITRIYPADVAMLYVEMLKQKFNLSEQYLKKYRLTLEIRKQEQNYALKSNKKGALI